MIARPEVATTIEYDCSICGFLIEVGEHITELSSGTAHVSCYSKSLRPDRQDWTKAQKPKDWRGSPGSHRPGVMS